ncbi:DUF6875 domain-containing protein [Nocardia sienata]|uniref:DUF6875 domain-containing protein n=1 Tax=Nocardia sienata TaxID=248552 RepID=UPI0007A42771|nr:hypothetical protein [Nocardia sienata]
MDTARWARSVIGGPSPALGRAGALCPYVPAAISRDTLTVVESTDTARPVMIDTLLDEAGWLAEQLGRTPAGERIWVAHLLVFTRIGANPDVLTEIRTDLRGRLLRQGITIGEFYRDSRDTSIRNPRHSVGRAPWPCFALRAYMPQDGKILRIRPDSAIGYLPPGAADARRTARSGQV